MTSARLSLSRGYRWSLYLNIYMTGETWAYAVGGFLFYKMLIIRQLVNFYPLTIYPRAEAVIFVIKGILYRENVLCGTKALCQYVLFRLNVLFRTKLQHSRGGCAA